jgi:hypothetical protein
MPFSMYRTTDSSLLRVQPTFNNSFVETSYNRIVRAAKKGQRELPFSEIFHDCWRVLFRPSEVVEKSLRSVTRPMKGMQPAGYVVLDLSFFGRGVTTTQESPDLLSSLSDSRRSNHIVETFSNAMSCALHMQQQQPQAHHQTGDGPFLVMTDDPQTANTVKGLAVNRSINIWTRQSNNHHNMLSGDDVNWDYTTFVDLYLMGMSVCVISNQSSSSRGGQDWVYLASLVGYDSTCYTDRGGRSFLSCERNGTYMTLPPPPIGKVKGKPKDHPQSTMRLPHFGKPMLGDGSDYASPSSPPKDKSNQTGNDDHTQKGLPPWMIQYFVWHNETRYNLSPSNWDSTQYLILGCLRSLPNCGGISDRLKPLPMILLEASRNGRLLLIWWERPKPLEEFFLPPKDGNGLDWTVPEWLKSKLRPNVVGSNIHSSLASTFQQGATLLRGGRNKRVIVFKIQSPTAGEDLYGEQPDSESTYPGVFHELFRRLFVPVPRLAGLIQSTMQKHGLVAGRYSSAHLRAMYGKRDSRDVQELIELTVLGINCASNLHPGGPIYFASDTGDAITASQRYANLHSLPVSSLDYTTDPIHLDKDLQWENRTASEYDPTFVDLYLLSQSRCVAYSNGGYGTFGSLLSHDAQCNIRFFKGRHKIKNCRWMSADGKRHELDLPNATWNMSAIAY